MRASIHHCNSTAFLNEQVCHELSISFPFLPSSFFFRPDVFCPILSVTLDSTLYEITEEATVVMTTADSVAC
jgi:hypothetical protein